MEHPQGMSIVWGPGFKGYQDTLSLGDNLLQKFPCGKVDIIYNFLGEKSREATESVLTAEGQSSSLRLPAPSRRHLLRRRQRRPALIPRMAGIRALPSPSPL